MGVSQVVEPHPRQIRHVLDKPREEMRQGDRLKRRTIRASADQSLAGLPNPEHQQIFSLLPFQESYFSKIEDGESDGAPPTVLRRLEPEPGRCLFQALDDADCPTVEIDVPPTKRKCFAAPCAGGERDHDRRVKRRSLYGLDQHCRLLGRQRHHLSRLDFGKPALEDVGRVPGNKLLLDGTAESSR